MRLSQLYISGLVISILATLGNSQGFFGVDRSRRQVSCPSCVLLSDCPRMLRLLRTGTRSAIYTVQRAICGFRDSRSMVCCPVPEPPVRNGNRPRLPQSCGFSNRTTPISNEIHHIRIYGGQNSSIGAYPWVAALGYASTGVSEVQFHCSGSLINERYILTAAHCLDPGTLKGRRLVEIRLGDWDLLTEADCEVMERGNMECAPPFRRVTMETAIIHPSYAQRFTYSDDIALIRLTETLDLNSLSPNIHPVCLPPAGATEALTEEGRQVIAVGWGMTESGSLSEILQEIKLPIVNSARCRSVYGRAFGGNQICAGGMAGRDTCAGDSGGPLIVGSSSGSAPYIQVGIVSFGMAVCGKNDTPAVYTDVRLYRDWILQNLTP